MIRSMSIRHVLPPLGALPSDPDADGVSGLVGACLGIATAQAALGHRVEVLGWQPEPGPRRQIAGVALRGTPGWPWARIAGLDFRVVGPLVAAASASAPVDILHAHSDPHLLLAGRAKARVLHHHTPLPERIPRTYSALLSRADAIVFCSGYLRHRFHQVVRFPTSRTFVVHNGVDPAKYRSVDREEERRRRGIAADDVVVLYAGAVVPEKGLQDLIRAISRFEQPHQAHLVVAGGSGLWQEPDAPLATAHSPFALELRAEAEQLPKVTWLGIVPAARMPAVYAMADIVVSPARWAEPFGMVNVEAMAAGVPVVASWAGGIPEVVADGVTGILVPPGDPEQLSVALQRLVSNPQLRRQLGDAGRQRAQALTWTAARRQLDAIYGLVRERLLPIAEIRAESTSL